MKLDDCITLLFLSLAFSMQWQSSKVNGAANEFTLYHKDTKSLPGPYLSFDNIFFNSGTLEFQFRTYVKNAVVLYQDDRGMSNYIELSLQKGRLNLVYNLESITQSGVSQRTYNDFEWHYIALQRTYDKLVLVLPEGENKLTFNISGRHNDLFTTPLLFGGFPESRIDEPNSITSHDALLHSLEKSKSGGYAHFFNACLKRIMYTNLAQESMPLRPNNMEHVTSGPCKLNECHKPDPVCKNQGKCTIKNNSVDCDCRWTGYSGGKRCTEPSLELILNGTYRVTYGWTGNPVASDNETIKFRIKTKQDKAVIMEIGGYSTVRDKLKFELIRGKLRVTVNFGSDTKDQYIDVSTRLNTGEWHLVEYVRPVSKNQKKETEVTVKIDEGKNGKVTRKLEHLDIFNKLDYGKRIYLGEMGARYWGNEIVLQDFVWKWQLHHISGEVNFVTGLYAWYNMTGNREYSYEVEPKRFLPKFNKKLLVLPTKRITPTSFSRPTPECSDSEEEGPPCSRKGASSKPSPMGPKSGASKDDENSSSLAWIVVVVVICAMILFAVIAFFVYRWNQRYSGDFQVNKKEIGPTGTIVRYNDTAAYYDDKRRPSIAKI